MADGLFQYGAARQLAIAGVPANLAFGIMKQFLVSIDPELAVDEYRLRALLHRAYDPRSVGY
ncbi:hypothetical protein SAMN06265173_10470 [Thalassovita litoralis]|jgi:hypothetical protein|uniref:Uncharacterized protein n=1 Tax=Thalassovita litoralis TaxID=1010611 RepID=A0A521BTC9_9RHOB|nr:hypothetical protein [Thalassovita litoralis]SMO50389.1 hypothetical protein SAMN06265173_10470 [Thalassovita litoralis]